MPSEEYLNHLRERIRREVISKLLVPPPKKGLSPEHPLPPPIRENLRKAKYDTYHAKRAIREAIDFIIQNKRAIEECDTKELFDFNVIVRVPPPSNLEDEFIEELKRKVDSWLETMSENLENTRSVQRVPAPHPVDPHLLQFLDPPLVMMLPRELKDVLHKHNLNSDPEVRDMLMNLQREVRRMPKHLDPNQWLLAAELKFPGYLDLLEKAKKFEVR